MSRAERVVHRIISTDLNYGRDLIEDYLRRSRPFRSVLDIGAGPGTDLLAARRVEPAAELSAIEMYGPNQAVLAGNGIAVHDLDLERDPLPFDDETVDVVIANQILEHTKEVFWILHEATRVLSVGGHLILGVPNLASLHNRVMLVLGQQPSAIISHSAHVRGFTFRDLKKTLELGFPQGYELVARGGSNFYPFPTVAARPLARSMPSLAWGMFLLLRKQRPYVDDGFVRYPVERGLETNFWTGPSR